MTDETALQLQSQPTDILFPATLEGLLALGGALVKSKLLPKEVDTPEAAAAIMLTARELGIPVMQGFRGIYLVNGKAALSAQLMAALLLKNGHRYKVVEQTKKKCMIKFARRGDLEWQGYEFTWEEAMIAGLTGKAVWSSFPKSMLFSRAMSGGCRTYFPDVMSGMYTPEELGAETVDVTPIDVETNWSQDPVYVTQFNDWCITQMVQHQLFTPLATIYKLALGVDELAEYTGTPAEAKEAVTALLSKSVEATSVTVESAESIN